MKYIFSVVFISFACIVFADQAPVDSVELINGMNVDSGKKIRLLLDYSKRKMHEDPASARKAAEWALNFAEGNADPRSTAEAHEKLGSVLLVEGSYRRALDEITAALELYQNNNNKTGMATCYDNMAIAHINLTEHAEGLNALFKSLKIWEELKNDYEIASTCSNIGNAYAMMGEFDKALKYHGRGLTLKEKIGNQEEIAYSLSGIGNIHFSKGDLETAHKYYSQSLATFKKSGNVYGEANSYGNLGMLFASKQKFDSAVLFFEKGIVLRKQLNDEQGLAYDYHTLSAMYFDMKNYDEALKNSALAISLSLKTGGLDIRSLTYKLMSDIYEHRSDFKNALIYYKNFHQLDDSISNDAKKQEVARQEIDFEYAKEAAKDSVKTAEEKKVSDAKLEAQDAQLKQEQTQRYALYSGVGLLMIFGFFMYNRFKVTQRQKSIIEKQKNEVEKERNEVKHQKEIVDEKNREILDSINYAKRLQDAILPPLKLVKEYLPESFILYKPKDIVAGDFYFMEPKNDKIIFAAADCTGHGVPGAMVSVVCSNALNRAVKEFGLESPAKILDKVKEMVLETFSKSENDVKDGMDISLCVLDFNQSILHFAGANNPLWLIRNNELIEFKADKQPIGKTNMDKPFSETRIELRKNDFFYLFTDGYEDQFGGEKGKKFKSANMKKLFLEIAHLSAEEQKNQINSAFENWRGDLEQVDDVCVIGIRI